jgi:putative zinc finger protein
MKPTVCGYGETRSDVLVSYLYGEITTDERARFELHLSSCAACRAELDALSGVRGQLGLWAAPEPVAHPSGWAGAARRGGDAVAVADRSGLAARWGEWPVWAQVAAAALFVGVGAGLANVHVSYTSEGLSVRTGWMSADRAHDRAPDAPASAALPANRDAAPWQADLSQLEERVRAEVHELATARQTAHRSPDNLDQALVGRLRALVQESERRQQSELALRLAEVARDMQAQRQADLVKIDRSLGIIQNRTGMEVMRQQQILNNLLRVSQRQ